jgi:hypothetical protein
MPRYPRYSAYDDGEFSTYDRSSHGPTSGTFSDGTPIGRSRSSRPSSSRQDTYDSDGYPMSDGFAGAQDLRRRILRHGESSTSSSNNPLARLGGSDREGAYESGRRSRLSEQVYADDRQARREVLEQQQAQLEYQMQGEQERERERRRAGRDEYGGRSGRRGDVTAANDEYLAYMQAMHEQQQREHDERPANVRRQGRGYFPAYKWR